MVATLTNEGLGKWLDMLDIGTRVRLFKSSITISGATTIDDFDGQEANFSGYAAVAVTQATASATGGTATNVLDPDTPPDISFTHNGGGTPNTIYGYYVTNASGTVLYYAESFPSSVSMSNNGDKITLSTSFTLSKLT